VVLRVGLDGSVASSGAILNGRDTENGPRRARSDFMEMSDYFAVFEVPRKLQLDEEELRRRFYELSRRHHPDFHQLAGEDEQAASLADSALINRAYRALRDPL